MRSGRKLDLGPSRTYRTSERSHEPQTRIPAAEKDISAQALALIVVWRQSQFREPAGPWRLRVSFAPWLLRRGPCRWADRFATRGESFAIGRWLRAPCLRGNKLRPGDRERLGRATCTAAPAAACPRLREAYSDGNKPSRGCPGMRRCWARGPALSRSCRALRPSERCGRQA